MIRIYLDGKLAIPKENQTIKLTSENFYFTKSASYTYDVELPLAIESNRKIFGNIHRMDISKESRTLEALLIVDNKPVLTGTAHITSVSEKSIKVQLLGEAASYNYGNKMAETYIDEIDLGNWYLATWPDAAGWEKDFQIMPQIAKTCAPVLHRALGEEDKSASGNIIPCHIYQGFYPWVAFPVYNSTADLLCNEYGLRFSDAKHTHVYPEFALYSGAGANGVTDFTAVLSTAVQPFIWKMAELIAKATGFTLEKDDNALFTNSFFRRIFIVSANNSIECNQCLPHWSVNEWWTQIENTFGLVMSLDYANKKMNLRQRCDHYRHVATTVYVKNVVDEYTADIEDETHTDISANNVGYADFDADPADLLDEYILKNCDFNTDFKDIEALLAWGKSQTSLTKFKGTVFKCADGREFIYTDAEGFVEVNMFRARKVDETKEDVEVELKFVPARVADDTGRVYPYKTTNPQTSYPPGYLTKPVATFPVRVLQMPDVSDLEWYKKSKYSQLDIEAIINEEEDEESNADDKNDVIYMAIVPDEPLEQIDITATTTDGDEAHASIKFPRPYLRERIKAALSGNSFTREDSPYSLSLIPIEGQENLANNTISGAVEIATKVKQCIRFVADSIPDPTSIFLIHNRKFICEKIEADIATSGLKKLMTGYFYELNL